MITRDGVMNKSEAYKGFTIVWQEPPVTSRKWTAIVTSDDRHLCALMGCRGVEVIDGSSRDEMLVAAKNIDGLLG